MVLENLDRTQWSFTETLAHIEPIVLAYRAARFKKEVFLSDQVPSPDEMPKTWQRRAKAVVRDQLLITLRDGDLRAQGCLSTTPTSVFSPRYDDKWRLHSRHHQPITPEQWQEGDFSWLLHKLTASEWEFIDIRVPRFMVKAIWPDYVPPADVRETVEGTVYSPPYLDLMEEAIAYFHLSDAHQEKKEALVEWFRGKRVEDAQISGNLAGAMATLVRLPSAQKGGAKRSWAR